MNDYQIEIIVKGSIKTLGRGKMKQLIRTFILLAVIMFFMSEALAHSGRTDACGGHKDRKRGGYHIHNYSKYCNCYPDAPECKKIDEKKKSKKKQSSGSEER